MNTRFVTLCRITLGLLLLTFGSDYFLHFMPELPVSKPGAAFLEALLATGYLFPVIKIIEIAAGILLLAGRFVPLALGLLAPIAFNIVLYHVFLDPNGRWIGLSTGILEAVLLVAYRKAYEGMWAAGDGRRASETLRRAQPVAKPSFGN